MERSSNTRPYVYCSGPLFSPEEKAAMQAIANRCENQGWQTFLPQRDGVEPLIIPFAGFASRNDQLGIQQKSEFATFALDIYYLLDVTNVVVCNLNGRVPDEGMIVEAAIAAAGGRPIVLYKNDLRGPFGGRDNAMLSALSPHWCSDLDRLPTMITEAISLAKSRVPGMLGERVEQGRRLGKRVDTFLRPLRKKLATEPDQALKELVDFLEKESARQDSGSN